MVSFYRNLEAGDSKAEALRKAQVEMLRTHPSPFTLGPLRAHRRLG